MTKVDDVLMPGLTAEKIMNDIAPYLTDAGSSYIDALVEYAEANNIEVQLIGDIVKKSPVLKAKVREDAESLRLVEKTARLPI